MNRLAFVPKTKLQRPPFDFWDFCYALFRHTPSNVKICRKLASSNAVFGLNHEGFPFSQNVVIWT